MASVDKLEANVNSNASTIESIKLASRVERKLLHRALVALVVITNLQVSLQVLPVHAAISRISPSSASNKTSEKEDEMTNGNIAAKPRQRLPLELPPLPPLAAPKCALGPWTYPIGARWPPYLPDHGVQRCIRCECTLKYQLQQDCFAPTVICQRLDKFPHCPDLNLSCPPSQERRSEPGACCPTCLPITSSNGTTTTSRSRPGSLWRQSRHPPPAQPQNSARMEPNYDAATGHETFWLFKVISKSADERELISAVKEVSFCPSKPAASGPDEHQRQQSKQPAQRSSVQSTARPPQRRHNKQQLQQPPRDRGRKER